MQIRERRNALERVIYMTSIIEKLKSIGIESQQYDDGIYVCAYKDNVNVSEVEWALQGFAILYEPSINRVLGVMDSNIPAIKQRAFLKTFTDKGFKVRVSAVPKKINEDAIDTLYSREEIYG